MGQLGRSGAQQSSKTTKKNAFSRPGKLKMLVLELLKA